MNLRVAKYQLFNRLWKPYGWVLGASAVLLVGVIMVVEMSYHLTLNFASGTELKLFGFQVDAASLGVWAIAAAIVIAGGLFFNATRRSFVREWGNVQATIEEQIQRGVRT
jgi:branched-chain amino acid transport system permease protein